MSKKKKMAMEEAARRQKTAEQAQRQQAFMGMPGIPYPAAPASQIVQMPPIVQPIVMVPFASQQQPLVSLDDDERDDDFDF